MYYTPCEERNQKARQNFCSKTEVNSALSVIGLRHLGGALCQEQTGMLLPKDCCPEKIS